MREFGRHEIIGEVEVLSDQARTSSIHAVRDTELAKLPSGLLHIIKRKHPQVATHLMFTMSQHLLKSVEKKESQLTTTRNLSTVALIPISEDVPLSAFARRLNKALEIYGPSLHLNAKEVKNVMGQNPNNMSPSEESQLLG